jgi:3D (Asp-Asp-Asp) domain-containing protein
VRMAIGGLALVLCIGILAPITAIEPVPVPKPEPAIQVEPSRGDRSMIFEATAYCYGTVTKTGTSPIEGRTIAVDPKVIPLGAQVEIKCETWPEVDGVYIAEDTGRLIKGNRVDLYMIDRDQCLRFGRRPVEVKVLD